MNKYLKIFCPFIFLISLFFIGSVKSIPSGKLWNNYSVLYVPSQTDDKIVLEAIEEAQIKDEVRLSGQYLPLNFSSTSVEVSMFNLNRDLDEYSYYKDRNFYFFDKSHNFRLYYIPSEYKSRLPKAIEILKNKGVKAGIDSNSSYPWIVPLIALIVIFILTTFSKKKVLFLTSSLVTIIYLTSNPFYPAAIASLLVILCLFFISNIWRRKGAFLRLIDSLIVPIFVLSSIVTCFSINLKSGFMFILDIICISSFIFTYKFTEDFFISKKSFIPVYIKSAGMVSIYAKKFTPVMLSLTLSSFVLLSLFFLTSTQNIGSKFSKLMLPANSQKASPELPQLEDYYKWVWNIETFPYRSLNEEQYKPEFTQYPHYKEDDGFISETKELFAYNQNYKNNVFNDIDLLGFNSIEKVLKTEGNNFLGNYCSTNSYSTSLFCIIMMIICSFVLLFVYFSIIIKKVRK